MPTKSRSSSHDDWHAERIKAAIRERGITVAGLGLRHGMPRQATVKALTYPNKKAEALIAEFLGVPAATIWPSRYHPDGCRKQPQPTANYVWKPRFGKKMW